MSHPRHFPTEWYPVAVVKMIQTLQNGIVAILGDQLLGLYLRGSLAMGDFDPESSDIDFYAITDAPISPAQFAALAAMHDAFSRGTNRYGAEIEGCYIARAGARRWQPEQTIPKIERGEKLVWSHDKPKWIIERWVVREYGLTLVGPSPETLIDPIAPAQIWNAVRLMLDEWRAWADAEEAAGELIGNNFKAYVVETLCRALATHATGQSLSKPQAIDWAIQTLPEPWATLARQAGIWHTDPTRDSREVPAVLAFLRWTVERGEPTWLNGFPAPN